MKRLLNLSVLAAATTIVAACAAPNVGGSAPQPRAAPVPFLGQSIEARLLDAHNRERASVGSPPLQWDPQLQRAAAEFARELAATGQFRHATPQALQGQGENLWQGTSGAFTPEQMVADWASGRRHFQPGIFPNVSRTGNWTDVGHYSQIIWPQTTRLGCALHPSRGQDLLVCRYFPAGNIVGARVP